MTLAGLIGVSDRFMTGAVLIGLRTRFMTDEVLIEAARTGSPTHLHYDVQYLFVGYTA
ncbi:MAG: hypothetical protein ACYTFA_07375 [Planctomycetota bacterium]|jgi:hypothetical protein